MNILTPTSETVSSRLRRAPRTLLGLLIALATISPLAALAEPAPVVPVTDGAAETSFLPAATAVTAASEPDGLSEGTAAASCWEIVQRDPSAADGVYWLVTPELQAPQQFYCDQTTDGGGWVLIGRGREHWSQSNEGRLTAEQVAQTPTGQGAFSPAQLPAGTVDGLLNDGRVNDLTDGVRLRRALTTDGSTWQETRFSYGTPREDWSWQFAGVQGVNSWTVGSSSGTGGTTGNFGTGRAYDRVESTVDANRGWARGFGYGVDARGSSAASSYVWASSATAGYPRPFTQVYLRPRLMSADIFTPIPATGLPERTQVATAQSYPLPTPWGVSGLGAGGTGELNTEVADFAESKGVMYVGGNFRYVQRDANGTGRVEQSYLAAFSVATGEWIPSFRPVLDNQVKAIAVLPDGRIAVGGAFSTVGGAPSPALAVLDPVTGARDSSMTTRVLNYTGGTPPLIRTMDVEGGHLYLGGRFTHFTGGGVTREIYQRNIGRLNASSLSPTTGWDPMLDGTVVSVDASARGDRIYAAGYFGSSKWTEETIRVGAFTADNATVIPWQVDFSNTSGGRVGYQQAVKEAGDRVWIGGAEHMLFSYDRTTMQELSTNITQNGGDFQAINTYGEDGIAAGCHCSENVYQGARRWPSITGFSRVEHIDQVGIWRASDGAYVPEYSPQQVSLRTGYGAWAIEEGSDGSLWVGGDYTYARLPNTQNQWTGAFVRFAARDAVAPSTPKGLTASSAAGSDHLTWDAVADATYEVLREDRVVATTAGTTLELPTVMDGARYFVRAVDQAGNRSASTPAVAPEVTGPGDVPVTAIAPGGSWQYRFETAAPSGDWTARSYDDSGWATGTAPLGWGHSGLGTTLTAEGTRPLTAYFRRSFTVEDASEIASLELTTRADDGVVVYVNGTEVGRRNMPTGTVGHTTYATAAPTAAAALANPVALSVPGNLLVTGENVVTAEVHANYRSTPTMSHELEAVLIPGEQGAPDPDPQPEPDPEPEPEPEPEPQPEPEPLMPIAAGSDWSHRYETAAPTGDWTAKDYDDSSWATGTAPLGWGHSDLGTTLTAEGTRPLTAYFRRSFTVEDASEIASLELTTRADDGVVVYVNGTEVGRRNMPTGTIGHGTYATAAPTAAAALASPVALSAPGSLLVTGENVVTAEVHLNYRSTPTMSHDLQAVLIPGEQGAPDPQQRIQSDPGPQQRIQSEPSIQPELEPVVDPVPMEVPPAGGDAPAVAPVENSEDTAPVCGIVPAAEDEGDSTEDVAMVEADDAPVDPDEVIALGSEWAFDCGTEVVAADWTSPALDDSDWQRGPAPLGWGVPAPQLGTELELGDAAPWTARYRHEFAIDALEGVTSLQLTLPADDGLLVHINGVEVDRWNLPVGDLDPSVRATPGPEDEADADEHHVVDVPTDLLVAGENTITVEVRTDASPAADSVFDAHGVLIQGSAG